MRILVTGGTGLLGNNVVRLAAEQGMQVHALARDPRSPSLENLPISVFQGDLQHREHIRQAAQGVKAIVHCGAHIHIGWWYLNEAMKINVEGTENVVEVARELNVRLIHVSTVNTLAVPPKKSIGHEELPGDGQIPSTYVMSKRASEKIVQNAVRNGLDALIMHPGFMLGPWDWKPSSGRMVVALAKNAWLPLTPIGGCSLCDVRDVASGILDGLDRGVSGRQYILAGYNIKFFDLWCRIADILGRPRPIFTPRLHWRLLGGFVGDLFNRLRGKELDFNSASLRTSAQCHWYSSERAVAELGYRNRPIEETLHSSIEWLSNHGYF